MDREKRPGSSPSVLGAAGASPRLTTSPQLPHRPETASPLQGPTLLTDLPAPPTFSVTQLRQGQAAHKTKFYVYEHHRG